MPHMHITSVVHARLDFQDSYVCLLHQILSVLSVLSVHFKSYTDRIVHLFRDICDLFHSNFLSISVDPYTMIIFLSPYPQKLDLNQCPLICFLCCHRDDYNFLYLIQYFMLVHYTSGSCNFLINIVMFTSFLLSSAHKNLIGLSPLYIHSTLDMNIFP